MQHWNCSILIRNSPKLLLPTSSTPSVEVLISDDLILRLSCLLGKTSKPNHVSKIISNVEYISLEENSTFNYTLYSELFSFFSEKLHINKSGICDFVANDFVYLKDVISFAKSNTKTGQYCYNSKYEFVNPIYLDHPEYDKSSLEKLNSYISNSE